MQDLGESVVEALMLDLAELVFDRGGAGQAAGLAPGGGPLALLWDTAQQNLIKYSPNWRVN